jgi:hypothetical protein
MARSEIESTPDPFSTRLRVMAHGKAATTLPKTVSNVINHFIQPIKISGLLNQGFFRYRRFLDNLFLALG